MKRVVVISDLHCGHRYGLTPPGWWSNEKSQDIEEQKGAAVQRLMWKWFEDETKTCKPVDVLIVNGDALDGTGDKTGGTEQIVVDRRKQCEMAKECIDKVNAKKVVLIYGTPYHTGKEEDWESVLADMVEAEKIGSHEWIDVNGLILDCKHKVSGSIIPHGRATSILRDALWNDLWSNKVSGQPKADVIIRSHVHYFIAAQNSDILAVITPALQGYGSKYGARQMSGIVDLGFIHFDVKSREDWKWGHHILDTEWLAAKTIVA